MLRLVEVHAVFGKPVRNLGATPSHPRGFEAAIEDAEWLLSLKEDFDGEGSPRYHPDTVGRALTLVRTLSAQACSHGADGIPLPEILPGPAGSVDLHWRAEAFELLVNIPTDPRSAPTFYGDNYGEVKLRGSLTGRDPESSILRWIL
jgi:hypothetical protein